jgi:hypothetical protein
VEQQVSNAKWKGYKAKQSKRKKEAKRRQGKTMRNVKEQKLKN